METKNSNTKLTYYSLNLINSQFKRIYTFGNGQSICTAGHNGPYYDIESPIRNTSHWLISFSVAYLETKNLKYKALAENLKSYLLQTPFIKDGVYIHRQKKDWANGVIGQAWVIEALAVYRNIFEDLPETKLMKSISTVFSFDNAIRAWNRIDPKNSRSAIDYTLNHQLWYAAALLEYDQNEKHKINEFLNLLDEGAFRVRNNGLICHLLYAHSVKGILLKHRYKFMEKQDFESVLEKEGGYHLFNLYPLARLYHHLPQHVFFKNERFLKALSYCFSRDFKTALENNKYGYPYNAPGFEFPFIVDTFYGLLNKELQTKATDLKQEFMTEQLNHTFVEERNTFSKNCSDPVTLTARQYEYWLGQYYTKIFKNDA